MRPRVLLPLAAAAAMLSAGCGDGTGPGGALTAEEEASLIEALGSAGLIAAAGPLTFGAVVAQADDLGAAGGQSAVGYQMQLVFTGDLEAEAVSTGLLGWTQLNTGANTVATAFNTGVVQPQAAFPATLDEAIGDGTEGNGIHYIRSSGSIYLADAGHFTMSSAAFGATDECPDVPAPASGFTITSCRFATGTMAGSYDFEATLIAGTGAASFSQQPTAYDLPAVRVELVIGVQGVAGLRAALGIPKRPTLTPEDE
jgi:hypothetical protein